MRKRTVCQIRLDNHPLKDRRGKWIVDFKSRNAPAAHWQIEKLLALGCKKEALEGIRFPVANVLISRMKKTGTAPLGGK